MDKRDLCQKAGTCFAVFAIVDVILMEFKIAPMPLADHLLTVFIVLLAISLLGSFYFKGK